MVDSPSDQTSFGLLYVLFRARAVHTISRQPSASRITDEMSINVGVYSLVFSKGSRMTTAARAVLVLGVEQTVTTEGEKDNFREREQALRKALSRERERGERAI